RCFLAVSIISNVVLILTITRSTKMQMGNYRYLLLCFATGEMISSLSHSWISPIVHLTETGFFLFPKHANELKLENASTGKTVCLFYMMTYYEIFNILTFHFIYRAMDVLRGPFREWTMHWQWVHWLAAALVFTGLQSSLIVWAVSF
ncbi:hypothetical protein PMAYCL1PPCAC_16318, partial [Pristionchus mayeri]